MKPTGKYRLVLCLAALARASPTLAGPPYEADDPVPTDLYHWEIYAFAAGDGKSRLDNLTSGLDLNYGAIPGLQLTATIPMENVRSGRGWNHGFGDLEIGAKYRVVDSGEKGFQVAVFPRVILPTSSVDGGAAKTRLLLPVWAQQNIGDWSVFGGGGYLINPGRGNRNNLRGAVAVTKSLGAGLDMGFEASWEGPDTVDGRPTSSLGLGSVIHLAGPASLLMSGGPSFSDGKTGFHAYSALGFTF